MLQRIGLAQALVNEPKLVILDEPTAGVDPAGSRAIRNIIVDLRQRGITVLLSSHLLTQVQEICDRVGILARDVLVREGQLEELKRFPGFIAINLVITPGRRNFSRKRPRWRARRATTNAFRCTNFRIAKGVNVKPTSVYARFTTKAKKNVYRL
jgi:ABC-type multidrug transport system ATPase subunit